MNPHYFGSADNPLFGITHPARPGVSKDHAVLFCPPVGHEHIRTHWTSRLLAQRLSREGYHVMRFDYSGVGDSSGWMGDIQTVDRWTHDIRIAADDLMAETGSRSLSIVGLRLGASLAALAADGDLELDQLILWEPVLNGRDYLLQLRKMHQEMLDLWVCQMDTEDGETGTELLGFFYRQELLSQINRLELESLTPQCKRLTLIDSQQQAIAVTNANGQVAETCQLNASSDWTDLHSIETAWLQSEGPACIVSALAAPDIVNPVNTNPVNGTYTHPVV